MRPVNKVYVHCSASLWGSLQSVQQWHKERKLLDSDGNIGYHYLILNGFPTAESIRAGVTGYRPNLDGLLMDGRPVEFAGAHVKGDNKHSIGICLIGLYAFTEKQLDMLAGVCRKLGVEYGLTLDKFLGHREYWENRGETPLKSCPNFDMDRIRQRLA